MKSIKSETGIIAKLERGEELIATLTDFCAKEGIQNAVFQGIGAVEKVQIGYYDLGKREYFFRKESGVFEVASMQGNVALVYPEETRGVDGPSTSPRAGKPFIHAHAVLSRCDASLECIGAHIKEAHVAVTLEIFMTILDSTVSRKLDDSIGLKLLDI
jgi:predicted DNA-binding protein with PD1-like motif